jgi:hypothetical protein
MTLTVVLVAVVILAAVFAIVGMRRFVHDVDTVPVPVSAERDLDVPPLDDDDAFSATGEPFPIGASSEPVTPVVAVVETSVEDEPQQEHAIAWPLRVAGRDGLDDEARTRLLGDLGLVRAPWCIPILAQAYAEESAPQVRCAALLALVGLRGSDEARAVLLRAAKSPDERERAIAAAALTDLPPAAHAVDV